MWVPCFSAVKGLLEAEIDYQMIQSGFIVTASHRAFLLPHECELHE
jgi:hypothetical protein